MTYEEEMKQFDEEVIRKRCEASKKGGGRDGSVKEQAEISYWAYVEHFKIMRKYGKVQGEMPPYRGKRASDYE